VPGIWRDPEAEERAFREVPLRSVYAKAEPGALPWSAGAGWEFLLPSFHRLLRANNRTGLPVTQPTQEPRDVDRQTVTNDVRAQAARLGLSQVGFARYDPKYTYSGNTMWAKGSKAFEQSSVIVCVMEQDWANTQRMPSAKSERAVVALYDELTKRTTALAEFIRGQGFRAQAHHFSGHMITIHYAVQAGLGQLGLNGQLLTPQAGSRCRLAVITTNAPVVHGQPVDYGVHAICDECQLCVRRCPVGAIPAKRSYHRGVMKAKIKTERCWPTVMQAHGCAVCMKVCPVQRYGLDPVKEHYVETGSILGKGTDELEGYTWIDGRHYGPEEKPRITPEFVEPGKMLNIASSEVLNDNAPQPFM